MATRQPAGSATTAAPTERAPRITDLPDVASAHRRLAELRAELNTTTAEREALHSQMREYGSDGESPMLAAAKALVTGGEAFTPPPMMAELRRTEHDVNQRIEILQQACRLQEQVVETREIAASATLCDAARPAYSTLADRLVAALIELSRADQAIDDFRESLEQRGIRTMATLPVIRFPQLGRLDDLHSQIRSVLRELEDRGFPVPPLPEAPGVFGAKG